MPKKRHNPSVVFGGKNPPSNSFLGGIFVDILNVFLYVLTEKTYKGYPELQKYRIKKIISNSTQSSCGVDLYGINGKAMAEYKNFKLFCSPNGLQIGDKIRMYNTRSSGSLEFRKAISYKVNGKMCVDIVGGQMSSLSDIKYFYSDMDFVDSVRLKCDVARALFERKIVPHFSAVRNLELLLFSGTAPVKTL